MPIAQTLSSPRFRTAEAVTKADRAKSVFAKYIIGLIILAFFCCLFYIWSRIQIVNVGYEINRELTHKEKLIEENKKLSLEIATLKSPVRLEFLAKNDYHMDLPQESQVLRDMKDLQIAAQPDSKKLEAVVKPELLKKEVKTPSSVSVKKEPLPSKTTVAKTENATLKKKEISSNNTATKKIADAKTIKKEAAKAEVKPSKPAAVKIQKQEPKPAKMTVASTLSR